ncbi:MAG TPA: PaaI family thioesterase [Burkholderiales bacterium]
MSTGIVRATGSFAPHGTIDPREVAHLSGLEFFQAIFDGRVPPPPIGKTLNFWPLEFEHGRAVFEGEPTREFYNPIGSIHGSYAAALLDSCMSCAVHTTLPAGMAYTTLEYKINLTRGMSDKTGRIRAEGKIVQVGRRIGTAEGRLIDEQGRVLAHGNTTCLIFEAARPA